ncbi:MAG: hypothetical protein GX431_05020 [Bacteroidales bacterium]|jgi:hypothetical protein|nr:hypothetical protein [Bacteroidales bacterium]
MKTDINNKSTEGNTNSRDNFNNINSLITRLREEDDRLARMMKNMKWLYIGMALFYSALMIVNPDPDLKLHHRISGFCYVSAFIISVVLFKQKVWEFSKVDYSLSSSDMLIRAAHRYKLSFSQYFFVLPVIVLIDAGLTISFFFRLSSLEPVYRILVVQAFYIPVILISVFIGYLIWRKKHKPLYVNARKLLKELNE